MLNQKYRIRINTSRIHFEKSAFGIKLKSLVCSLLITLPIEFTAHDTGMKL